MPDSSAELHDLDLDVLLDVYMTRHARAGEALLGSFLLWLQAPACQRLVTALETLVALPAGEALVPAGLQRLLRRLGRDEGFAGDDAELPGQVLRCALLATLMRKGVLVRDAAALRLGTQQSLAPAPQITGDGLALLLRRAVLSCDGRWLTQEAG